MKTWLIVGGVSHIELIAEGNGIRDLERLRRIYGRANWKKKKGLATIRFTEIGVLRRAEIHWYEAHGIGKREEKIKTLLD